MNFLLWASEHQSRLDQNASTPKYCSHGFSPLFMELAQNGPISTFWLSPLFMELVQNGSLTTFALTTFVLTTFALTTFGVK